MSTLIVAAVVFTLFILVSIGCGDALAPTVRLNNGLDMPAIGLGTYLNTAQAGECERAVRDAIDALSSYRYGIFV